MNDNVICWDLIRTIVGYVPLDALSVLSKASPMFDREICALGIHVFYDREYESNGVIPIRLSGHHTVIQLSSGKKDVIIWTYDHEDLYSFSFYRSVRIAGSKYIQDTFCREYNDTHEKYGKYLQAEYEFSGRFYDCLIMEIPKLDMIHGIDFISCHVDGIIEGSPGSNSQTSIAESFKVIYEDLKWIK